MKRAKDGHEFKFNETCLWSFKVPLSLLTFYKLEASKVNEVSLQTYQV